MKSGIVIGAAAALLFICGCGPGPATTPEQKAEAELRATFASLKRAVSRGERDAILWHMSPATLRIFESALAVGTDPDGNTAEKLSQISVILGFQARWLLGADQLKKMSPADFFEWCVANNLVPLRGLRMIDLQDVKIDGVKATACTLRGGITYTNEVLTFQHHEGRWRFNFHRILAASEAELFQVRSEQHLGVAETAILILERMYQQPIPSLREILLPPQLRQQAAALKGAPPSRAYAAVLNELSAGRQREAEELLRVLVAVHTNDQRLAFAQAVCTRSRFSKNRADEQFARVLNLGARTAEGKCARYLLNLDDQKDVEAGFRGLHLLAAENPDDPLIPWMIGVQCREHYLHTRRKDRSEEGLQAYKRVLEIFDIGPVLVHQTYANLLSDQLCRHEEALPHRRIAVVLEPKAWTYQGLGNTLREMGRYQEADEAFYKIFDFDARNPDYWQCWALNFGCMGRWEECAIRCKRALSLDPDHLDAKMTLAWALEQQGKLKESLEQLEEVIRMYPVHPSSYDAAARVLTAMGEKDRAQEYLQKKAQIHGQEQPADDRKPPAARKPGDTTMEAVPDPDLPKWASQFMGSNLGLLSLLSLREGFGARGGT